MKNITIAIIALVIGIVGTALVTGGNTPEEPAPAMVQESEISSENPFGSIPAIDAYYEGEKIWFIHTEVSDSQMAQRLSTMVASDNMMGAMESMETVFVPRLSTVPKEAAGKLYVFTNGVTQDGVKPWGGGPFGYQIDVFDSLPGQEDYTPLRNPYLVTWNEDATPRILKSVDEILVAEKNNELTIVQSDVIVNAPVVQ